MEFSLSNLLAERQKNIASYQESKNAKLDMEYNQIAERVIENFSTGNNLYVRIQRGTRLWHHTVFEKPTNVCRSILDAMDRKVEPMNETKFSNFFNCKVTMEAGSPHPEITLEIETDKKKVGAMISESLISFGKRN